MYYIPCLWEPVKEGSGDPDTDNPEDRGSSLDTGQPVATREGIIAERVVYVLRKFPELSETFIRREMRGLMQAGVPVTVIAVESSHPPDRPAGEGPAPGVRYLIGPSARAPEEARPPRGSRGSRGLVEVVTRDVVRLRGHPRRSARCLRLARFALRARRYVPEDARRLHAHFANDAAALARYVGILTGLPYAVTAHAYDLYQDPFLLGPNLAAARQVYTVSRANLELLRSRASVEGWDVERFSVLRCGIDLAAFPYRDPGTPRDPARLLCVARLVPKKGHAVLLEAMARLAEEAVPVKLTVAGEGDLDRSLRNRASELNLGESVEFAGAVPPERVRELLVGSDLAVLASRIAEDGDRDGLPVTLIEASAVGVPVVSTAVSGIPELITPETGWLAPPDRPDLLAKAIRAALADPHENRVTRARSARRAVEAEFDLHNQIEVLRNL